MVNSAVLSLNKENAMFDNIKGRIKFEAIVPDSEKFINTVMSSCVVADSIQYKNGKIIGEIYKRDFNELKDVGKRCGAHISILEKKGFVFDVLKYNKRIGLMIGIIVIIFIIYFLSDIIMIIDVYGNEHISDSRILDLAKDSGIHIGAHISDIDLRKAERVMVSSSDEISWIGIRSSGCKVQIEVYEVDSAPDVIQKNIPCNIVSTKDAQIVDIKNVYSGMLVQMLNNGVKKGDLLISGTVEDGKGGVYYTHSMGEIIGRYTETITFTQPYCDEKINYDNPIIRKSIHILGFKIPLYIEINRFDNYELNETVTYLDLFDIQLPAGMIYMEYNPYSIQKIEYSRADAESIILNKIEQYELNFLNDPKITVIDKKIEYVEKDDSLKSIVKYTIEGNIGISKEIMVK